MRLIIVSFIVASLFYVVSADDDDCATSCTCESRCNICRLGAVTILCLKNATYSEMGRFYGLSLKRELTETLDILKGFYGSLKIPYKNLIDQADLFQQRYVSSSYGAFLSGVVTGSGLTINDCHILNAMETLSRATAVNESEFEYDSAQFGCAFAYIPPALSANGYGIVARNYDYSEPFNLISGKNLVVTIIRQDDKMPTAIIGMPGQIYCPTCINAANVFVELNNGHASGGDGVNPNRKTLLLNLLEQLQESDSLSAMLKQLWATESDYALIINTADSSRTASFEFSTYNGMKPFLPSENQTFVSTNFFLNTTWNLPPPKNSKTSMGVIRRNNLMKLLNGTNMDVDYVKRAMNVTLKNGGALWKRTIYQMIFDTKTGSLFIRAPHYTFNWTQVDLNSYFGYQKSF